MLKHMLFAASIAALALSAITRAADEGKVIRIGIIGCDTSHVPAFTNLFNDPKAEGDLAGFRVVAAFPGGSPDIPSSRDRVEGYTRQLRDKGIEIVDSIPRLLEKVDVVLLESVDGRPHLEQVRPVFAARKPVFIDKPLAGTLADAIAIYELGKQSGTPWFSASSLRFSPGIIGNRLTKDVGDIQKVEAWSPCSLEPHHPDLFWYGVHGVEILYTIMGPGCLSVERRQDDTTIWVTGKWKDGRVGIFRGAYNGKSDYGATITGTKGTKQAGKYEGYKPLCEQIGRFFKTGVSPVDHDETLEMFAFMEAADESKRQSGASVTLESVMKKARGAR
jgi:predicted dehydrogenase